MSITPASGQPEKTLDDKLRALRLPTVGVNPLADGTFRLIDARDLHRVMQIRKAFSAWFDYQRQRLGLQDGFDYLEEPLTGKFGQVDARGTAVYLHPSVAVQIALLWRGPGAVDQAR